MVGHEEGLVHKETAEDGAQEHRDRQQVALPHIRVVTLYKVNHFTESAKDNSQKLNDTK